MTTKFFSSEIVRVAGESEVVIKIEGENVRVEYNSLASPRSFESLVEGRKYWEVPYVVSRVCGVCSHAHFWASNLAIESALGIKVDETTATLRDACNKLQILQNHIMHLGFLVLPDYEHLVRSDKYVSTLLRVNRVVTEALNLLGGRLTNPNTYLPGGFTIDVKPTVIEKILSLLRSLNNDLRELANVVLSVELPELTDPSPEYASLRESPNVTVPVGGPYVIDTLRNTYVIHGNYREIFVEQYLDSSTSKKCLMSGKKVFYTGARARLLNYLRRGRLNTTNELRYLITNYEAFFKENPFSNIYAKIIESLLIYESLLQALTSLEMEKIKRVKHDNNFRGGFGVGVIEAPRGLLIHYYEFSPELRVVKADIITPTVMFSKHLEVSSEALIRGLIDNERDYDDTLVKKLVEALIRAYDPCIPCAVHVIKKR
ncbi:MAG: nickel-dependent hydrogenase large subunit [Zestosphaera sp.]